MAYLVQKLYMAKILALPFLISLTACSRDSWYKWQMSGGDGSYLKARLLDKLQAPTDLILPTQNDNYNISVINRTGVVGKRLDIRPPTLPLALINGAQTRVSEDKAMLLVKDTPSSILWDKVLKVIKSKNYILDKYDGVNQNLSTNWIEWKRSDEKQKYRARYQVSVTPSGYQQVVTVKLITLEQGGYPILDRALLQRYSIELLNIIVVGLEKISRDTVCVP